MKKEYLKFFPHVDLTVLGLIIFLLVFIAMLIWVYRRGSGAVYAELARLPLEGTSTKNSQGGYRE